MRQTCRPQVPWCLQAPLQCCGSAGHVSSARSCGKAAACSPSWRTCPSRSNPCGACLACRHRPFMACDVNPTQSIAGTLQQPRCVLHAGIGVCDLSCPLYPEHEICSGFSEQPRAPAPLSACKTQLSAACRDLLGPSRCCLCNLAHGPHLPCPRACQASVACLSKACQPCIYTAA